MGRRILNYGMRATHARITSLTNFNDPISVSDFDAFGIDQRALGGQPVLRDSFVRRQAELADLVLRKGGLIICLLRPPFQIQLINAGTFDPLTLFDGVNTGAFDVIRRSLRLGVTTKWSFTKGAKGVAYGYLRTLSENVHLEAFLAEDAASYEQRGGAVIATNSAGWPVSVEFIFGTGRVCFVPDTNKDVPEGKLGTVVARMVEEHYGGAIEVETPNWVDGVAVPGANANDARIAELEKRKEEIDVELGRLGEDRSRLLNFRVLLFGYGKSVLEPAVRQALRELGFKVLQPEEYEGEWDVDLTDQGTGKTAVGEVEGSEGSINIDKLRQLLDYVEAEENAGRSHKGILIGNGYRLKELADPLRSSQFTEMAIKRAKGFEYCLLATSELFLAVCAVLKSPNDDALKQRIRNSILSTVGVWKFAEGDNAGTDSIGNATKEVRA